MKRRLKKGIAVFSTNATTSSNSPCFDDDDESGSDANGNEIESHTALLEHHVGEEEQKEGMKMKTVERKRRLGSKRSDYEKKERSNTFVMKSKKQKNTAQDDGNDDDTLALASDEEEEGQEEEEEEEGRDGTEMWDAMNRILDKPLKGELNNKPVLALRKTKAMKEMDEEKLKLKNVEEKKIERRRKLSRQMVDPRTASPEKERLFRKVATKGVVGLFNAIAETQHCKNESPSDEEGNVNEKGSNKKSGTEVHHHHNYSGGNTKTVSKASFLDLLRKKTQEESLETTSGGKKSKKDETDGAGESTWSVLRDDYMLGSVAMKDWDKESA